MKTKSTISKTNNWQTAKSDPDRLKENVSKMRQALETDEQESRIKGTGLPEDWRSRIIR